MKMKYANLDGKGQKRYAAYGMPDVQRAGDWWANVTDVPCPVCKTGTIRWHEAGYTPGSRLCDGCGRFFQARRVMDENRISSMWLFRDARFDKRKG